MQIATLLFFGILILPLKLVCGFSSFEVLKFCVFAGDFDLATLSENIKERSGGMMFSVVVNFEQLSNFLISVQSKSSIVTPYEILEPYSRFSKRTDLYWFTMSDLKDFPSAARNTSLRSLSFSHHKNESCGSVLAIGVLTEEGICDNMIGKNVFEKTDCYHYQLMDLLGRRLNFTKRTIELEDKEYPYIFPNGSHSGLFRMVSDQNVDVSCGSFVVTGKRMEEYDFLWPTFFLETMMYLKRDDKSNPWSSFMKPFEKGVWAAIILFVVTSAFIRYILHRILFLDRNEASFYNSFLLSLQIFCNQGTEEVPGRLSIRLVHLLSLLAVIVLNPVYSGSVVSFLTINTPRLPFRDFEGLVANPEYSVLTSEGDFMTYYLYFEMGDHFNRKRENLLIGLKNLARNAKEGMRQICDGETLTYVDSKQNLADLMNGLACDVIEVPNPIIIQHTGMIIEDHLPCRDQLASGLRYLRSTGIIQRMQSEMIPPLAFARLKLVHSGLQSISLAEIYPCLVLQALGLLAAAFIFLLEIIFGVQYPESKGRRRRRHNQSLIEIRCEIISAMDTLMM